MGAAELVFPRTGVIGIELATETVAGSIVAVRRKRHIAVALLSKVGLDVARLDIDVTELSDGGLGAIRGQISAEINEETLEVWKTWCDGRPRELGSWKGLGEPNKRYWLRAALGHRSLPPIGSTRRRIVPGSDIDGYVDAFCAIGEAVGGAGFYFGSGLDALEDCLQGGFGVEPPFVLVWKEHDRSRAQLGVAAWPPTPPDVLEEAFDEAGIEGDAEPTAAVFDAIIDVLTRNRVVVHLE